MLTKELYQELEHEFRKNRVGEEVEDVLLELAESIADSGPSDREVLRRAEYGKHTVVEACGICSEEDGETNVLIKWVRIGRAKLEIEDYFL